MHASSYHFRSSKFPVLQEDRDECCNPGTYGKSLVDYLQQKLESKGYEIPFTVAEDFGWWIEVRTPLAAPSHIVLRRLHENQGVADFAIAIDDKARKWSWKRFRFIDLAYFQEKLASDLWDLLTDDAEIELIDYHSDSYPDDRLRNNKDEQDASLNP